MNIKVYRARNVSRSASFDLYGLHAPKAPKSLSKK